MKDNLNIFNFIIMYFNHFKILLFNVHKIILIFHIFCPFPLTNNLIILKFFKFNHHFIF